jgi:uncharacterized membrane protein HdeD (DUF308 family)
MRRLAIALLFALVAYGWPLFTLASIAILFTLYALIDGLCVLLLATRDLRGTVLFGPLVFEGVIALLSGALAIAVRPFAIAMTTVVSMWAIATGALELHLGLGLRRARLDAEGDTERSFVVGGTSAVVLGLVVALGGAGAEATPWFLTLALQTAAVVFGALMVGLALRLRSLRG